VDARRKPNDKRKAPRQARKISCELWVRGTRHPGVVKDISSGGLFLQTEAKAAPGTAVTLVFHAGKSWTEIRVAGRVVRADRVQPQLAEKHGGIGIEVTQPGGLGRVLGDLRLAVRDEEPNER
jgi:Tfp pilus assembly protein PilZ